MRVIAIGAGKAIYFLARRFLEKNYHVTVVTPDPGEATELSQRLRVRVIRGDGSTPARLEDAEAGQADVVLALLPRDEDNLVACQIAKAAFGVPRAVAVVSDPDNVELFRRLGVDAIFSTTEMLSQLMEQSAGVEEITHLVPIAGGRVNVAEVLLPEDAPAAGRELKDLRIPPGTLVGGIIRGDEMIVPGGATRLDAGDRLLLLSKPEDYGPLLRALLGAG